MGFKDQNSTQKRPRDAAEDRKELPNKKRSKRPPKEKIKKKLLYFAKITGEVCAALETDASKLKQLPITFERCRSVSNSILLVLQRGDTIDEEMATLYRDTTGKLAAIAAGERAVGNIPVKKLDTLILHLGHMLELGDRASGIPAALSDPILRSTRLKLKKYADDYWDDMLLSLQQFARSIKRPGRVLNTGNDHTPLHKLLKRN